MSRTRWAVLAAIVVVLAAGIGGFVWVRQPASICIAFVDSLSGSQGAYGAEGLAAARLYIEQVNDAGGIRGRPVELMVFDDRSTPEGARAIAPAIVASPCLAVLGHGLSTASVAAGPIYGASRLPAVTGTAFADAVTRDNPWYFRANTTNSVQGRSVAEYAVHILKAPVVDLLVPSDAFGDSFLVAFVDGFSGSTVRTRRFDPDPARLEASAREQVEAIARETQRGLVVIGAAAEVGIVLKAVRRAGIHSTVLAADLSGSAFLGEFADEPEERQSPGFFTLDFYAATSIIFDSAGAAGYAFAAAYEAATKTPPSSIAAGFYQGAMVLVEAVRRAQPIATAARRDDDRMRVRDALAGIDRPATAIEGLDGRIFFDANRDVPRPMRFGYFLKGRFISAPLQLVQVDDPARVKVEEEIRAGNMLRIADRYFWRQRVIYTGIDMNRINRVNIRDGTFNADFYLWMRYAGDDDLPTRVDFPNLTDSAFNPDQPLERSYAEGLHYRLYRIAGNFRADFDLHDYPFDIQELRVRFQNSRTRRELVAYVTDIFGLGLAEGPGPDETEAFLGLPLWRYAGVRYLPDPIVINSTLGKPIFYEEALRTEFPGFSATLLARRSSLVFMTKTLLPLFLLTLVVFATLFFPPTLNKERTTVPVTGLVASAVLLVSMNNGQLPDIGYTVAIETAFHVFFGLALMALISGLVNERLRVREGDPQVHDQWAKRVNVSAKVIYVVTVIGLFAFYWLRYGR
jgi:ABC-type branched-subunit amino acid transport system substrate-binding protein